MISMFPSLALQKRCKFMVNGINKRNDDQN